MTSPSHRELFADDDFLLADEMPATGRSVAEWVAVMVGAVLVALVIKSFLIQAFFIPSDSMVPTLLGGNGSAGDRVLVNKLSYRIHDVDRGDVVVFERPPTEPNEDIKDLIKRVIGLPGDRIYFDKNDDGRVYVNDQPLLEPYLAKDTLTKPVGDECTQALPCVVPEGRYWVMGDNRGMSRDSRYFGPISKDLIVGRAFVIVWPLGRLNGL